MSVLMLKIQTYEVVGIYVDGLIHIFKLTFGPFWSNALHKDSFKVYPTAQTEEKIFKIAIFFQPMNICELVGKTKYFSLWLICPIHIC